MKILTIVGARPQFIKAAVVSRYIQKHASFMHEEIIHTGQHYDHGMSQVFFDEMGIPHPAVNLKVGSGAHGLATAEMLKGIEAEIIARKPDYLLVYGDTNSTIAGALAAAKLHVPVAHIEAGERSNNRKMPEEINRVLTDHISSLLFCCSGKAQKRLASEGIHDNVFVVGDVMYEAFLNYLPKAIWPKGVTKLSAPFALATIHRAQNTDDVIRLKSIFTGLANIPEQVVLPLHPRTLKIMRENEVQLGSNIHLLNPVSYFEMLGLLKECSFVMTDSGGLQKEAYYAGKRCVVLRDETEWVELVDAGVNKVSGINPDAILDAAQWAKIPNAIPQYIYGNGHTSEKLVKQLAG